MTNQQCLCLSIIIPSGRDSRRDLLESLLSQVAKEDEIIVVNDSPCQNRSWTFGKSKTETRSAVTEQQNSHSANWDMLGSQIRVQHSRGGASVARNIGWRVATNDWVLFLDDDVEVQRGFLQSVRESIRRNSDSDLVGFRIVSPPPETGWERMGEETLTLDRGPEQRTNDSPPVRIQNVWMYGAGAALAVDHSLLERMNGFKDQLGAGRPYGGTEDTEFLWHASHHGIISYDGTVSVLHGHPSTLEEWRSKLIDYGRGVGFLAGVINTQDAVEYAAGFCNFIRDSLETPAYTALPQHEQSLAKESIDTAVTETIRTLNFSRESVTSPVVCYKGCRGGTK